MVENIKRVPCFEFSDVDILEFTSRPYLNKRGESVVFKECLVRIDNKVLKFGVAKDLDLTDFIGKTVSLSFELNTWGDSLAPSIRIVSLV